MKIELIKLPVRKLLFSLGLFALPFCASTQVLVNKYAQKISEDTIKKHVFILASDSLEGRETGRKGQILAADYLETNFKTWGLQPVAGVYQQSFNIREGKEFTATVKLNKKKLKLHDDFFFSYSIKNPVDITGKEIVFIGYGLEHEKYNDYANVGSLEGKVVLMLMGEPKDAAGNFYTTGTDKGSRFSVNINLKTNIAKEKGAAGVILINESFVSWSARIKLFFSRGSANLEEPEADNFFVMHVPKETGESFLKKEKITLEGVVQNAKAGKNSSATLKVPYQIKAERIYETLPTSNVLAMVKGKKYPEEFIVVTAHYDHIGVIDGEVNNGADDNASGTSAVLELARVFSKSAQNNEGPDRSIIFMGFSGEEKGLLGSRWFTDYAPLVPLENIVANLNIDMIGRYDSDYEGNNKYVYLIGSDKLSLDLHNISEQANNDCCNLTLDYKYNRDNDPNRFYYRSDHYNFAKNDIPVIFYFNGTHPDYHQPGDTPDKIATEKVKNITELIFHTLWELANREERIQLTPKAE
ncbi:MAG: M28 family peptidase [Luteibaculaceae bacterium]